ncbi:MAG: SAM-dependent methyltransferase [Cyclobacteriaceae bacterium]|nr:SAM-dependent methyltransferase [Cyclobacteriaceae bacterium]
MSPGTLYLIPNVIAEATLEVIPQQVIKILPAISHFLVEDVRTARRYLSSLKIYPSIEALHFEVLNKDTPANHLASLMSPLSMGLNLGVLSESGCPGVADPGALAVGYAHQQGIRVVPLVGPSSILLSLMASGLNGQQFAFHGYLPVDAVARTKKIKELEQESKLKNQTQLLIETPYRNNAVFESLLKTLQNETQLTVAMEVTGISESIQTRSVNEWKKNKPNWPKSPAVFLFLA